MKCLKSLEKKLTFYPGVIEILQKTKELISTNPAYSEFDIKVEHYVVSTGLVKTILGSKIMPHITYVWGCELLENKDADGNSVVCELGYTIDNTSKTKALFEINKGSQINGIDVNSNVPENLRRVHFKNMIYIAVRVMFQLFLS